MFKLKVTPLLELQNHDELPDRLVSDTEMAGGGRVIGVLHGFPFSRVCVYTHTYTHTSIYAIQVLFIGRMLCENMMIDTKTQCYTYDTM